MNDYLTRSKQLLGEEAINSLADKCVLVIGLGGVGGTAFEALVRSGIKHFIIIDHDKVDASNLNRQLLYTSKDIGRVKVDAAKERALSIVTDLDITTINEFIDIKTIENFKNFKIDYIVDAIDKIPSKIAIVNFARSLHIKVITSLGMGNRIDPEKIILTTLDKTENDPLAKKLRSEFRKEGIPLKEINVVFSKEEPLIKDREISSMIMTPSTAGLLIAKKVITDLIKG